MGRGVIHRLCTWMNSAKEEREVTTPLDVGHTAIGQLRRASVDLNARKLEQKGCQDAEPASPLHVPQATGQLRTPVIRQTSTDRSKTYEQSSENVVSGEFPKAAGAPPSDVPDGFGKPLGTANSAEAPLEHTVTAQGQLRGGVVPPAFYEAQSQDPEFEPKQVDAPQPGSTQATGQLRQVLSMREEGEGEAEVCDPHDAPVAPPMLVPTPIEAPHVHEDAQDLKKEVPRSEQSLEVLHSPRQRPMVPSSFAHAGHPGGPLQSPTQRSPSGKGSVFRVMQEMLLSPGGSHTPGEVPDTSAEKDEKAAPMERSSTFQRIAMFLQTEGPLEGAHLCPLPVVTTESPTSPCGPSLVGPPGEDKTPALVLGGNQEPRVSEQDGAQVTTMSGNGIPAPQDIPTDGPGEPPQAAVDELGVLDHFSLADQLGRGTISQSRILPPSSVGEGRRSDGMLDNRSSTRDEVLFPPSLNLGGDEEGSGLDKEEEERKEPLPGTLRPDMDAIGNAGLSCSTASPLLPADTASLMSLDWEPSGSFVVGRAAGLGGPSRSTLTGEVGEGLPMAESGMEKANVGSKGQQRCLSEEVVRSGADGQEVGPGALNDKVSVSAVMAAFPGYAAVDDGEGIGVELNAGVANLLKGKDGKDQAGVTAEGVGTDPGSSVSGGPVGGDRLTTEAHVLGVSGVGGSLPAAEEGGKDEHTGGKVVFHHLPGRESSMEPLLAAVDGKEVGAGGSTEQQYSYMDEHLVRPAAERTLEPTWGDGARSNSSSEDDGEDLEGDLRGDYSSHQGPQVCIDIPLGVLEGGMYAGATQEGHNVGLQDDLESGTPRGHKEKPQVALLPGGEHGDGGGAEAEASEVAAVEPVIDAADPSLVPLTPADQAPLHYLKSVPELPVTTHPVTKQEADRILRDEQGLPPVSSAMPELPSLEKSKDHATEARLFELEGSAAQLAVHSNLKPVHLAEVVVDDGKSLPDSSLCTPSPLDVSEARLSELESIASPRSAAMPSFVLQPDTSQEPPMDQVDDRPYERAKDMLLAVQTADKITEAFDAQEEVSLPPLTSAFVSRDGVSSGGPNFSPLGSYAMGPSGAVPGATSCWGVAHEFSLEHWRELPHPSNSVQDADSSLGGPSGSVHLGPFDISRQESDNMAPLGSRVCPEPWAPKAHQPLSGNLGHQLSPPVSPTGSPSKEEVKRAAMLQTICPASSSEEELYQTQQSAQMREQLGLSSASTWPMCAKHKDLFFSPTADVLPSLGPNDPLAVGRQEDDYPWYTRPKSSPVTVPYIAPEGSGRVLGCNPEENVLFAVNEVKEERDPMGVPRGLARLATSSGASLVVLGASTTVLQIGDRGDGHEVAAVLGGGARGKELEVSEEQYMEVAGTFQPDGVPQRAPQGMIQVGTPARDAWVPPGSPRQPVRDGGISLLHEEETDEEVIGDGGAEAPDALEKLPSLTGMVEVQQQLQVTQYPSTALELEDDSLRHPTLTALNLESTSLTVSSSSKTSMLPVNSEGSRGAVDLGVPARGEPGGVSNAEVPAIVSNDLAWDKVVEAVEGVQIEQPVGESDLVTDPEILVVAQEVREIQAVAEVHPEPESDLGFSPVLTGAFDEGPVIVGEAWEEARLQEGEVETVMGAFPCSAPPFSPRKVAGQKLMMETMEPTDAELRDEGVRRVIPGEDRNLSPDGDGDLWRQQLRHRGKDNGNTLSETRDSDDAVVNDQMGQKGVVMADKEQSGGVLVGRNEVMPCESRWSLLLYMVVGSAVALLVAYLRTHWETGEQGDLQAVP